MKIELILVLLFASCSIYAAACDGTCEYCDTASSAGNCLQCAESDEYIYIDSTDANTLANIVGTCVIEDDCVDGGLPVDATRGLCFTDGECPDGFYKDGVLCQPCENNCLTCSSATQCLSCPYTVYTEFVKEYDDNDFGTCVETVPGINYFLEDHGSVTLDIGTSYSGRLYSYVKCHSTCQTCDGPDINDCTTCGSTTPTLLLKDNGYHSGRCVADTDCYQGAYDEDQHKCVLSGICDGEWVRDGSGCAEQKPSSAVHLTGILLLHIFAFLILL